MQISIGEEVMEEIVLAFILCQIVFDTLIFLVLVLNIIVSRRAVNKIQQMLIDFLEKI